MSGPTFSEAIAQYGLDAYLLTTGKTGPHISNVVIQLEEDKISCAVSTSTAMNIESDPRVSLFWPPLEQGGYGMVVNGNATGILQPGGVTKIKIKLTKSVLHRPGPKPADSDGPCSSDCRRVIRD